MFEDENGGFALVAFPISLATRSLISARLYGGNSHDIQKASVHFFETPPVTTALRLKADEQAEFGRFVIHEQKCFVLDAVAVEIANGYQKVIALLSSECLLRQICGWSMPPLGKLLGRGRGLAGTNEWEEDAYKENPQAKQLAWRHRE